jgi:ATP-dependent RNA helicase RhlE
VNFEQFSLDLPTLHQLTQGPLRQVRALIVAPTRELAEQIYQMGVDLGQNTPVRSVSIYGGVSKGPQVTALQRGAEIVVAYPGSLQNDVLSGEFYAN